MVLAAVAVGVVAALAGSAFADNLTDTLAAGSVSNPSIDEGGSFSETIDYQVDDTNGKVTFPAGVSFSLSAPSWVHLSATSLSFTAYTDVKTLTVSGTAPAGSSGTYSIGITPSTTAANLNPSPAKVDMSLTVSAPAVADTTAPVITFDQSPNGSNGWFTTAPASVRVTATDSDDGGVASLSCTLDGSPVTLTSPGSTSTTMSGTISTSTDGDHAVACQAADSSNNAAGSDTALKLDTVDPSVSGAPTTAPNPAGWYDGNVTVHWTCSDATSLVVASGTGSCPADSTISTEGRNQTANSGPVLDNAGNSSSAESSPGVNIDETAPNAPNGNTSTAPAYTDGSGNAWYSDDVIVSFTGNGDPLLADGSPGSGVASVTGPQEFDSTNVDAATGFFTYTGQATDNAGNTSTGTTVDGYVDWQAPEIISQPATDPVYTDGSGDNWWKDAVSFTVAASDPAPSSGLQHDPTGTYGPYTGVGTFAARTAVDNVGHSTSSDPIAYNVDSAAPTVTVTPTTPSVYTDGSGNDWWKGSVGFTVAAGDPAPSSGLATNPSGTLGPFTSSGTVPAQTAVDNVGHSTSSDPVPYQVDSQAPTFGACSGGPFLLNSGTQDVSIAAQDETGGSGLDTADSTLSGTVDTSTAGPQTVTFTAFDNVGNEAQTACTYDIDYNLGIGFLRPLNPDITGNTLNVGNAGKTYPIKWQLTDANGAYVTNAVSGTTVDVFRIACANLSGDALDTIDYNETSGGTALRYDSTANQYVYNWQTPSAKSTCYRLTVTLAGSGQQMIAAFQLK